MKNKKNLKKKIISAIISIFITFFPIIVVATGVFAIFGFAMAIVNHAAEFVSGVKESIAGKGVEETLDLADLSSYDVDKMLEIIDDKKVISEELLDQMMMERDTLKEILKKSKEYNETYDSAKKKIEVKHIYTVDEITNLDEINGYGAATQEPKVERVKKEKYEKWDYEVSAETYEKEFHNVNWQSVYLTAVEETLQNYGANVKIQHSANADDVANTEAESSTEENTEDSSGGEDAEENDSDSFTAEGTNPNANSLGVFQAGWVPSSDYFRTQEVKYHDLIEKYAAMYNLPSDLIRAIISQESGWNPKAQSGAGAKGLCQFTTVGWKEAGIDWCGYSSEDVWDPEKAIHACAREIAYQINYYDGNVIYALTGYNRGRGGTDSIIASGAINQPGKLIYAAGVLTYFTGRKYTGQQLAEGNYIGGAKVTVTLGYGTMNADGRISLTTEQIDELIYQFEPKYDYNFDVVRDDAKTYDFETCQELPNYGEKSKGDPDTEEGQYIWYEPVSMLSTVQTPYLDVTYSTLNIVSDYSIRLDRWESMVRFYWPHYDAKLFGRLVDLLPKGSDVTDLYDYYASIASNVVEYDGSASEDAYSGVASAASGNYTPLSGVTPSIKIPEDCGGLSIPLYLQYDSRWNRIPFGGGTISSSGCGATSIAMVLSYELDKCIYPNDIVALIGNRYYVAGAGQSWAMIPAVAKMFGCSAKQETVNADKIIASLEAGHPVIVSTSGYGTTQEFTKHGHYIVLRGLTADGKVLVNDPNDNASGKKHYAKAYTAQFIYSECCSSGSPKVMYTITGPKDK